MAPQGSDRNLSQLVTQRLTMRGFRTPCKIVVNTTGGEVTLSGTVQFAHQRAAAAQTAEKVPGVRRVVDRMTVAKAVKR